MASSGDWNSSSSTRVVFNRMFDNFCEWHVLVWIAIINIKNGLTVFELSMTKCSLQFFFVPKWIYFITYILTNTHTKFKVCTLKPWLFARFGCFLLLTAHVLPLTTHRSCLSFPWLWTYTSPQPSSLINALSFYLSIYITCPSQPQCWQVSLSHSTRLHTTCMTCYPFHK